MRRRVTALGLLAAVVGCNPQAPHGVSGASPPSPTPSAAPPHVASYHFSGHGTARQPIRIVQQRDNRKQYELLAHSYESDGPQGSARTRFQIVHVTFFARDGSRLIADAPRAIVDEIAKTVTLLPNVHAHKANGVSLVCDELIYMRGSATITGRGHVAISDAQGLHATGNRFDSDVTLSHIRMQ
jgi:hypothetical protein